MTIEKRDEHIAKRIKATRRRRGLTRLYCSDVVGCDIELYEDIETYGHVLFSIIPLVAVRRLFAVLSIDLFEDISVYFDIAPVRGADYIFGVNKRHIKLRNMREEIEKDKETFEEMVGWEFDVFPRLCDNSDEIDLLPIQSIIGLASLVKIDPFEFIMRRGIS